MGAQGGPAPVRTLTEEFIGDRADQALVAELCQRLGFAPNTVVGLHVTADRVGIRFSITHTGTAQRG